MPTQVQHVNCGGTINWSPIPSCNKCGNELGWPAYISFRQFQWVQVQGKPKKVKSKAERPRLHPSRWPIPLRIITVGVTVGTLVSLYLKWLGVI